jgi:hypothetical protein
MAWIDPPSTGHWLGLYVYCGKNERRSLQFTFLSPSLMHICRPRRSTADTGITRFRAVRKHKNDDRTGFSQLWRYCCFVVAAMAAV